MEDFPHFVWAHDASEVLDTEMWERVQSIVNLVEDLRNTNAEAAAYHSLVQCIPEGTTSEMNRYGIPPVSLSNHFLDQLVSRNSPITDNPQSPVSS